MILFGGSFDPFHNGHLSVLQALEKQIDSEAHRVHILPYFDSLYKHPVASAAHRAAMINSVLSECFESSEAFVLNSYELDNHTVSFTIDTVTALKKTTGESIGLVIGYDQFEQFHHWKSALDLLEMLDVLYIVSRPGHIPQNSQIPDSFHAKIQQIHCVPTPVSSQDIRDRIAHNQSVNTLIPDCVLSYITRNALYAS